MSKKYDVDIDTDFDPERFRIKDSQMARLTIVERDKALLKVRATFMDIILLISDVDKPLRKDDRRDLLEMMIVIEKSYLLQAECILSLLKKIEDVSNTLEESMILLKHTGKMN